MTRAEVVRRGGLALLVMLGATHAALAGSFTISPVRVDLSAAHPIATLTLHNQDGERVLVQARATQWSQAGGTDQFADTREVLITPPVFELSGHAEQIVRVALRREPDPARELSYRIFLEEVPQPRPAGATGVGVALRLSIPAFVAAAHPARPDLVWQAQRLPDARVRIDAMNRGDAHVQIAGLELRIESSPVRVEGMRYLLPGSRASWLAPVPATAPLGQSLEIHGFSDQGEFTAQAARAGP